MYTYIIFLLTYFKSYEFLSLLPSPPFTLSFPYVRVPNFLLVFSLFFFSKAFQSTAGTNLRVSRGSLIVGFFLLETFLLFFALLSLFFDISPFLCDSLIYNRGSQPNDFARRSASFSSLSPRIPRWRITRTIIKISLPLFFIFLSLSLFLFLFLYLYLSAFSSPSLSVCSAHFETYFERHMYIELHISSRDTVAASYVSSFASSFAGAPSFSFSFFPHGILNRAK